MLLFSFCAIFCKVPNFGLQFMKYIKHHIPPTTKTLIAYNVIFFFLKAKKNPARLPINLEEEF